MSGQGRAPIWIHFKKKNHFIEYLLEKNVSLYRKRVLHLQGHSWEHPSAFETEIKYFISYLYIKLVET